MTDFFDDWGSQENPVRQSDLNALFGGWGCQKRWAMGKIYPVDEKKPMPYRRVMGELVHRMIWMRLVHNKGSTKLLRDLTFNEGRKIQWDNEPGKDFYPYHQMIDELFKSKEFESLKSRIVDCERSFMMRLGDFWVAGTIDLIVKNKSEDGLILIDWKTSQQVMSQFEMDNGYQSNIYALAVKQAEFFLKPEDISTGRGYYESWKNTKQRNVYNTYPQLYYSYLKELIPAARASKRESRHGSSKKMADKDGIINLKKGERRGPVFYEAVTSEKNIGRLEYSLKCAVYKARTGLFDESIGPNCEKCHFQEKCKKLGTAVTRKQQTLELMDELGIEPT